MKVLIINGPNLNLLGLREPEIYGNKTYEQLCMDLQSLADTLGLVIDIYQSNHEGALIDRIQQTDANAILINAGAYTHTSIALRDVFLATKIPFVEVHLSNVYARESFRHRSYLSDISIGQIVGFGTNSYILALHGICSYLRTSS